MFLNNQNEKRVITGNGGFSFIEIVIALSVLSIGILGVSMMQTTAVTGNNTAMRTTSAVAYASDQMEKVLGESYATLAGGTATDGTYTVSWTVDPAVENKKKVHVKIDWKNNGASQTFTWHMIRSEKI